MKPVDQMTDAEVAAERAAIAAERAQLEDERRRREELGSGTLFIPNTISAQPSPEILSVIHDPAETVDEPAEDVPWPYQYGRLKGHIIEVRAPAPAALVAISMTGSADLTSTTQMMVFSTFMTKHISAKSLDLVLGMMADPDSGVDMQDVISALTERVELPE